MKNSCPARLIDRYRTIAVVVLNTIVLMILLNVIIEIAFLLRDQFSHRSQELFDVDGKPFDNGKRSSYHLKWFDYTAYERHVDASYAGNVLDDFFNLSRMGCIYQPWVQFSERVQPFPPQQRPHGPGRHVRLGRAEDPRLYSAVNARRCGLATTCTFSGVTPISTRASMGSSSLAPHSNSGRTHCFTDPGTEGEV